MAKPSYEWVEADLLDLIANDVQESIDMEYKACASLKNADLEKDELSKDVSAFANSAGGTILYGMKEKDNRPESLDVGFEPNPISREWLEQVINTRIQRRIPGIRINPITLNTHSPGKVAFAVYVPQSPARPHQARDKKFYKRFNFQSVPMEEYEIRDMYMRTEGPLLTLRLVDSTLANMGLPSDPDVKKGLGESYELVLTNEAAGIAEYMQVMIFAPRELGLIIEGWERRQNLPVFGTAAITLVDRFSHYRGIPNYQPAMRGPGYRLTKKPFSLTLSDEIGSVAMIGWTIIAPKMPEQAGWFVFKQLENGKATYGISGTEEEILKWAPAFSLDDLD